uniref:Uncharacterized protein n=1 Tax=uncultured Gemmatimonadales bacterium HF0770_11C06 TaxID=723616 RepID=E7C6Y7_9BACT|nr:hypothetical protein [uncultured Gemmatimonadales bacterium HF0770_11C06]
MDEMLGSLPTGVDDGDGLRQLNRSVGDPTHETVAIQANAAMLVASRLCRM